MTMAPTLERYLMDQGATYRLLSHPLTQTAAETAHASHISGNRVAKGVLLADGDGYLLAVLPASHQLDLDRLGAWLGRPVSLASEQEVGRLFPDCELGAIPAVGWAYGLDVIVDDSLATQDAIWFEAGDHRSLVEVGGDQFRRLLGAAPHGVFSIHD